jgi:heme-degrading monooxygenase HmoA
MSEIYTTGTWVPTEGREHAFVEAWAEFAAWASTMPGAGRLRLGRDLHEPGRFVSFGDWESGETVAAWKMSPEFKERMAQVLQHVGEFKPSELELLATATQGASTIEAATTGMQC